MVDVLSFGYAPMGSSPMGGNTYNYASSSPSNLTGSPYLNEYCDWEVDEFGRPKRQRPLESRITLCLKTRRGTSIADKNFGMGPGPEVIDQAGLSYMEQNIRQALSYVEDEIDIVSIKFDTSSASLGRLLCTVLFNEIGQSKPQFVAMSI